MDIQIIKKNTPNFLTFLRLILTFLFIISFFLKTPYAYLITFYIFCLASVTDFLDGFTARIWNAQSKIGKIFDHITDKIMTYAGFIMLIAQQKITELHAVAVIILFSRDLLMAGIRQIYLDFKKVLWSAKFKTVCQIFTLGFLIVAGNNDFFIVRWIFKDIVAIYPNFLFNTGYLLLWISVILSVYSFIFYIINEVKLSKKLF